MSRAELINRALSLFAKPAYLEIGVDSGETFKSVKAVLKHGVDPCFKFDISDPVYVDESSTLFVSTSDQYFNDLPASQFFDVIFIDGLHEFSQVLVDLLNSLSRLSPNGIVIVDDVLPCHYQASLPTLDQMLKFGAAIGSNDMSWMGDVYKLIFFIRDYLPAYSYATSLDLHGQTLIWRGPRDSHRVSTQRMTFAEISSLQYVDSIIQRDAFNIVKTGKIFRDIAAASAGNS